MRFEKVIIVSDMDGTFLGRGATVVPENVEAVEYFNSKGGKFTFATGRVHYNIFKAVKNANLLCNIPAVTVNGACIYDLSLNKIVYENPMNVSDVKEVTEFADSEYPHIGVRCSTEYGMLTNRVNEIIKKDIDGFEGGRVEIKDTDKWIGEKIYKVVFRAQAEQLLEFRSDLERNFAGRFNIAASSPRFLELNSPGCSKADGIEFIRNYYENECKVKPIVFAVGDYENDLQMLNSADYSVCPSNASDRVKAASDFVLCDCDDGVIGELVKLIERL